MHQSTISDKAKPIARWGRKTMGLIVRDSRVANTYWIRRVLLSGEETAARDGISTGTPHLTVSGKVRKPREHIAIMLFYKEEV
jgi:hypothetical protein